MTHSR